MQCTISNLSGSAVADHMGVINAYSGLPPPVCHPHSLCFKLQTCVLPGAGPVLNLSFLIDDVMEGVKPLYWDSILEAPIPLKVGTALPPHTLLATLIGASKEPQMCFVQTQ